MTRWKIVALAMVVAVTTTALAVELVGVRGSSTQFTTTMDWKVNDKPVKLLLTGVALRQKLFVNVYAIASYLQEGATAKSAEDLAAIDVPKQLHVVMERTVGGTDMADAFRTAIRMNYPEPILADEVNQLVEKMRGDTANKGDHIYLTHLPGVGLQVKMAGREDFLIRNPELSRAVWDIYLGRNNLGEGIKRGLTSRLPQE
jgi:hypothetical protein